MYIYFTNFQKIDEEEYGGPWELTKEGFMTSFALFLVSSKIHYVIQVLVIYFSFHEHLCENITFKTSHTLKNFKELSFEKQTENLLIISSSLFFLPSICASVCHSFYLFLPPSLENQLVLEVSETFMMSRKVLFFWVLCKSKISQVSAFAFRLGFWHLSESQILPSIILYFVFLSIYLAKILLNHFICR